MSSLIEKTFILTQNNGSVSQTQNGQLVPILSLNFTEEIVVPVGQTVTQSPITCGWNFVTNELFNGVELGKKYKISIEKVIEDNE